MTDRTELRRLLDEATPGPWEARTSEATMNDRSGWRIGHPRRPQAFFAVMRTADAQLIAAAVNALPDLLDQLDAAEAALACVWELHERESYWQYNRDQDHSYLTQQDAADESGCDCPYAEALWPCPTIRALGGEQS